MIKEILSKTAFLSLGIMALSLSLNPARAMEEDEEKSSAPTVLPDQYNIVEFLPEEVQILTLQNLSIKDLGLCALVCHKWNDLSSHEGVWREVARNFEQERGRFSGCYYAYDNIPSWKEILKKTFANEKEEKEAEVKEKQIKENKQRQYERGMISQVELLRSDLNFLNFSAMRLSSCQTFQQIEAKKMQSNKWYRPCKFELFNPEQFISSLNLEPLNLTLTTPLYCSKPMRKK